MDQQRICMQLESIRWKIEEEKNAMKAEASRVKKKTKLDVIAITRHRHFCCWDEENTVH